MYAINSPAVTLLLVTFTFQIPDEGPRSETTGGYRSGQAISLLAVLHLALGTQHLHLLLCDSVNHCHQRDLLTGTTCDSKMCLF
jgi:hypothetical protein